MSKNKRNKPRGRKRKVAKQPTRRNRAQKPRPTFGRGTPYRNNSARGITVTHREVIAALTAQTEYEQRFVLTLNPGLTTFPWLSQIASAYESYLFDKLHIRFITCTSTITNGSIIIAPEYDPEDDDEDHSYEELLSYQDAITTPVYKSALMKLTRSNLRKHKTYYVRKGSVLTTKQGYDVARLEVLMNTKDYIIGTRVGYLVAEYTVRLFTPQTSTQLPIETSLKSHTTSTSSSSIGSRIWDTIDESYTHGNLDSVVKPSTSKPGYGWLEFTDPGYYYLDICAVTSSATTLDPTSNLYVGDAINTYTHGSPSLVITELIEDDAQGVSFQNNLDTETKGFYTTAHLIEIDDMGKGDYVLLSLQALKNVTTSLYPYLNVVTTVTKIAKSVYDWYYSGLSRRAEHFKCSFRRLRVKKGVKVAGKLPHSSNKTVSKLFGNDEILPLVEQSTDKDPKKKDSEEKEPSRIVGSKGLRL